jgi:sugar lactone lactonase YvrE
MRVLVEGLVFGESARWHEGRLWVCDWGTGEVIAVGADGATEVVVLVPSYPLCIDWLPDGRMLAVSGADGRLLRLEPDGRLATHAELGELSSGRWNEVAVDCRGNAYVNGGAGVIARVDAHGAAEVVATGLAFPNGMVVTPDGSTLIVAESHAGRLTAFDISPDNGTLAGRRVWAALGDGAPDGIALDDGALWYADVPHQRCVRVTEGGEVLDQVEVDRGCFSCAVSDDGTLFIVATEWHGFEQMFTDPRTGRVLAHSRARLE